ncbi:MAG: hypothetical protein U1E93_13975 [Alphaproteobacteria bacterium]
MCLIVDANVADELVLAKADAAPILNWLEKRKGFIATGGKNLEELLNTGLRSFIQACLRDGRARNYSCDDLSNETTRLTNQGAMKSDDPHVIALASKSRARVVFTRDKPLMADFRDRAFIDQPRGSIYTKKTHVALLAKCSDC